jgi:hypothetical protein
MGMTYNYVAGFASSVSILFLDPQLALWARRMSPASLAGSVMVKRKVSPIYSRWRAMDDEPFFSQ